MDVLFKKVTIIQPNSDLNRKVKDVLVKDGVISAIGDDLEDADVKLVEGQGKFLSIGWFDLRAQYCDPGFEHKEDVFTGLNCAAAGGFTAVAVMPNTNPTIQTKESVSYLIQKASTHLVDLYPIGAVTKNTEGKELTEMADMHKHGALAFSDGQHTIWHTGILLKSLQYVKPFDSVIINSSRDLYLSKDGQVHEGYHSTLNGMKGVPAMAETMAIKKDLEVLRYAGGRLHFSLLSTAESVTLLADAKKEGLDVSCDVAAHYLKYSDEVIGEFNTHHKVQPPFRSHEDRLALLKGLKDGVVDCVVSDHTPVDIEGKKLEYDYADFGLTAQETVYPLLNNLLTEEEIVNKLAIDSRNVLGLNVPELSEGEDANLCLFDASSEWTYNSSNSKSLNSPLLGEKLKGKVIGVYNKGTWKENEL